MNKDTLFKAAFATGFLAILIYAWLKIIHAENADIALTVGIAATLIYTVMALYEIHSSAKIDISEKIMWTVGFIFINTITGLIYLLAGRQRVTNLRQREINKV